MANELKITIGGDASGLAQASAQSKRELSSLTNSANQAGASLKSIAADTGKASDGFKKLASSAQSAVPELGQIESARLTVKRLKDEISSLSAAQLKSPTGKFLSGELKSATKELKELETQSGLTANTIANPLTKSFGLLRTAANILPGIGIAGIIGAAATFVTDLVTEITKGANAIKEANQDIANSFAEAAGKSAGEVANLSALLSVARDETLSKSARTQAIKELNKEYDAFLPKLSLENINTRAVQEATDKLTNSLIRQAKIKGLQELISKETQKQAELFASDISDNATALDKFLAVLKSPPGTANLAIINAGVERTGKEFQKSTQKLQQFNDFLKELTKEEAINGTLFEDKNKKAIDLLKQRIDALKALQAQAGLSSAQQIELVQLEVQLARRDGIKSGLKPTEIEEQVQGIIEKAFPVKTFEFDIKAKANIKLEKTEIRKDIQEAIGATKIDVDFGDRFIKQVNQVGTGATKLLDLSKAVQKSFSDIAIAGTEFVGEAISAALSGGDSLASVSQKLVSSLGDILIQLGKTAIAAGIGLSAISKALKSLNPAVAIAAGVGLLALGSIIKKSVGNIPKFASGGIATGPTVGLFGEAGREAIIPLDKLPSLLGRINNAGNLSVTLVPTIRFSMNDFIVGFERGNEKRRRLG